MNNDIQEAECYYSKGKFDKALSLFLKNYEKEDMNNDLMNYIGCCYLALEEYQNAVLWFECLINKSPEWERPVFNLGRVYMKLKDTNRAFELFQKAIAINSLNEDALFYMGWYYYSQGDYDKAEYYYVKSLKINDCQSETHMNLGMCYLKKNLLAEALEEFVIAFDIDKDNTDAMYNQGRALRLMKQYAQAILKFKYLHELFPEDFEYIMDIAECYFRQKEYFNAQMWNDKILNLQPNNPQAQKVSRRISALLEKRI